MAGRLYCQIGVEAFFELLNTNGDKELSPAEIQATHDKEQLDDN